MIKKNFKKLYDPGFNCLKATEPLQGDTLLLPLSSQESWYSFYRPRKDERLSQLWNHLGVLTRNP